MTTPTRCPHCGGSVHLAYNVAGALVCYFCNQVLTRTAPRRYQELTPDELDGLHDRGELLDWEHKLAMPEMTLAERVTRAARHYAMMAEVMSKHE